MAAETKNDTRMEYLTLPDGKAQIPVIGLGTWKAEPDVIKKAVTAAIEAGYRHIDCSSEYGNEKDIGVALNKILKAGNVRREDLWITSKLENTFHRKEHVKPALEKTLKDLQLDYLDLFLIHWPNAFKYAGLDEHLPENDKGEALYDRVPFGETWAAMEECVDAGLVRYIGVCNYNIEQLTKVIEGARIKPAVLQVECHPCLPQMELSQFCKDHNMIFEAYSSLGSSDRPWAEADDVKVIDHPTVKAMAEKYGVTPAQVLIRYQIDRGHVLLAKSSKPERIASNLNVFSWTLLQSDVEELSTSLPYVRYCNPPKHKKGGVQEIRFADHPDYPFPEDTVTGKPVPGKSNAFNTAAQRAL